LIKQSCDANNLRIIKGVVSVDHLHLHIEYPSKISVSEIVRKLKGRSARKLMIEYPELKKKYYGGHFWGIGYGAWSSGNVTEELINDYLDHHENGNPNSEANFILE
jgi:putative transposase